MSMRQVDHVAAGIRDRKNFLNYIVCSHSATILQKFVTPHWECAAQVDHFRKPHDLALDRLFVGGMGGTGS